jgi:hypothetical protein
MFLFYKFSAVNILPKEAAHKKNDTLEGTLGFQMLFHGKEQSPTRERT